jgi:hypothetical protein
MYKWRHARQGGYLHWLDQSPRRQLSRATHGNRAMRLGCMYRVCSARTTQYVQQQQSCNEVGGHAASLLHA